LEARLQRFRVLLKWHRGLSPLDFVKTGAEPDVGYLPLAKPVSVVPEVSRGPMVEKQSALLS
jgi:hypothetical protein